MNTDLTAATNMELVVGRSSNVYVAIVQGGRLSDIYRSGDGRWCWWRPAALGSRT